MRVGVVALEMLLLLSSLGCRKMPEHEPLPRSRAASRTSAAQPRRSSPFELRGDRLWQAHPRLPDAGEWRCAERGSVIWCAGGGPAAGVAMGRPDSAFRCGPRWGGANSERICIDPRPEYSGSYRSCRFEQERGIARVCRESTALAEPLTPDAVPACWLDGDCSSGRCDRGACRCMVQADCARGRCVRELCVEAP